MSGKALQKVSFLVGPFAGLKVTNFDVEKTYKDMEPLCVKDKGVLAPATEANEVIVAYAVGAPVDGHLEIISA